MASELGPQTIVRLRAAHFTSFFSPKVDLPPKEPVKELWAVRKEGRDKDGKDKEVHVHYKRIRKDQPRYYYTEVNTGNPWRSNQVTAILIPGEGAAKIRFDVVPSP